MLVIHQGEHPNSSLSDMTHGLSFFWAVNNRPTWLKVFYFTGTELLPLEYQKPESIKGLTVDNDTVASTPGKTRVNRFHWARCYPKWPLIWGGSFLALLWLALIHGWGWWLPAIPLLMMNFLYWIRVREHFNSGDVCPAVVISIKPLVLAVGTDLTTGFEAHPAIKVIQVPSASLPKQHKVIGTRIATAALYSKGLADAPRWNNFDPRPIGAATTDLAAIEDVARRIPANLWHDFDAWLKQVPKLTLGLHNLT